jgi:hypothetical protein
MRSFLAPLAGAARTRRSVAPVLAALLGSGLLIGTASAAPNNETAATMQQQTTDGLQPVRWVCGPYRCWWGPDLYRGGPYWRGWYWGPRPYYWDWRGHWYY